VFNPGFLGTIVE